jgi:ribose-phosphate pyrophosphokinase
MKILQRSVKMISLNGEFEIKFESFPNGESKLLTEGIEDNLDETMNVIYFKYENDGDLIRLMFIKHYLDYHEVPTDLVISYMPYSRMDRSEDYSPFSLKYIADFINNLNFNKVLIVEPHSDVTPAIIHRSIPYYINFDLLPKVEKEIGFDREQDYLFFPDAGAQKRYHNLRGYKQLVGFKDRDWETGEIKSLEVVGLKEPCPSIKKVLIVDDLSSYGGTFIHSGEKLKELGFEEIYLLVAHAENSIFERRLLQDNSPITKVFTTDSILTKHTDWANKKYESKLKVYEVLKERI